MDSVRESVTTLHPTHEEGHAMLEASDQLVESIFFLRGVETCVEDVHAGGSVNETDRE